MKNLRLLCHSIPRHSPRVRITQSIIGKQVWFHKRGSQNILLSAMGHLMDIFLQVLPSMEAQPSASKLAEKLDSAAKIQSFSLTFSKFRAKLSEAVSEAALLKVMRISKRAYSSALTLLRTQMRSKKKLFLTFELSLVLERQSQRRRSILISARRYHS